MLKVFWDSHDAAAQPWSTQYMSILFYHNEEQRRLALESKKSEEARSGFSVVTEIIPFSDFFLAEDYHQKYYLRQEPKLFGDLNAIYPELGDFIDSTAVARLNGYAGGYGTPETFNKDLDRLGLSEAGQMRLMKIKDRGIVPGCASL